MLVTQTHSPASPRPSTTPGWWKSYPHPSPAWVPAVSRYFKTLLLSTDSLWCLLHDKVTIMGLAFLKSTTGRQKVRLDDKKYDWTTKSTTGRQKARLDDKKYDWTTKSTTGRQKVRLDDKKYDWTTESMTGRQKVRLDDRKYDWTTESTTGRQKVRLDDKKYD